MIEQDLFLSGNCHDRRPRCRRHGGRSKGSFRNHARLQGQILGHRRRTFRFSEGYRAKGKVRGGFLLLNGLSGCSGKQALVYPKLDQVEVGFGDRIPFRRHVRLLDASRQQIDQAVARVPGDSGFSRASAGKYAVHAREVESALCLVRIVAGIAGFLEEGQDVVLEIRFFLAREKGMGKKSKTNREGNS